MPPKKKTEAPASQSKANEQAKQNPNAPGVPPKKESQPKSKSSSAVPAKRKAQAETKHAPSKAPRRSARGPSSAQPDPVKLIKHLLSPASLHACRPKDEIEDLRKRGKDLRTYSSSTFTPFEELICAVILSRPISHALGLRSIRTLFNEPHNFTTPKKIREAGFEPVRKALDEARTQHRQKTAEELVLLADAVAEHLGDGEEDVALERVRRECGYDWPKVRTTAVNLSVSCSRSDANGMKGERDDENPCQRFG